MKKILFCIWSLVLICIDFRGYAQTSTFNYTGAVQTYTVPAGFTAITVDVQGAKGGGVNGYSTYQSQGGAGGRVQATITVTPGHVLSILVGGMGSNTGAGGYGGGGSNTVWTASWPGAGGGGYSSITDNTTSTLLLVAGGGGGGGGNAVGVDIGGQGGDTCSGCPAGNGESAACITGGHGGSSFGGLGEAACSGDAAGGNGASLTGGNKSVGVGAGGGGGGYFGGGSGSQGGGGGGGSSYTNATYATATTFTSGYNSGNGTVVISIGAPAGIITGTPVVCLGYTTALSDTTSGGTWSSSNTSVAIVGSNTGVVTGLAAGTVIITYALSGSAFTTQVFTVKTIPIAITGTTLVCPGQTTTLHDGSVGGTWSTGATGVASVGSLTGVVNGISVGTAIITYSTGCGTDANITIAINSHISAHNVINNSDTLCNGADFYISACGVSSFYNVTTYFGDGTSTNIALTTSGICHANVFHTYSSPGTYYVKQVLYNGATPDDSVSFSYEYLYCRTLPVKFYLDANGDCIKESSELYNLIPLLVQVDSNGVVVDTISVTGGLYYKAYGLPGTIYSFSVISGGLYASCPSSGILYDTIVATVNTYPVKYFGLSCFSGSAFDLMINASLITGKHAAGGIIVVSNGYCNPENAVVTINFSPKYIFSSSSPSATSIAGNTVSWDLSAVSANTGTQNIHFYLNKATPIDIPFGDTIHSSYMVTPIIGDFNPTNNNCVILDTIKASYDPNEMFVSPSGCIHSDSVTQLRYTINFENTGNDTAHNISVMDTLSANIDPKSLRIVAASAVMNIALFNDGTYNIVKFDFPQIDLLDSSHHDLCDGMVIFNINTLPGLPDGTTIFNHAGIFFDDNPVVMTDTVENITGCIPAAVNSMQSAVGSIQVFPNPATNELTILSTDQHFNQFTISNSIGQELIQQPLTATQTKVNVNTLPAGLYYIMFRGDNGTKVQKFVKL